MLGWSSSLGGNKPRAWQQTRGSLTARRAAVVAAEISNELDASPHDVQLVHVLLLLPLVNLGIKL